MAQSADRRSAPLRWSVYVPSGASMPEPSEMCTLPRVDAPDGSRPLLVVVSSPASLAAARDLAAHYPDLPVVLWEWRLAETLILDAEHDFAVVHGWPSQDAVNETYADGPGRREETRILADCESAFGLDITFDLAAAAAGESLDSDGEDPLSSLLRAASVFASSTPAKCAEIIHGLWDAGMRPPRALVFERCLSLNDIAQMSTQELGLVALDPANIPAEVWSRVPAWDRTQYQVVPFEVVDDVLHVASPRKLPAASKAAITKAAGGKVEFFLARAEAVTASLTWFQAEEQFAEDSSGESPIARKRIAEQNWLKLTGGDEAAAMAVELLLLDAISNEVSDIHIETWVVDGIETVVARMRVLEDLVEHKRWPQHVGQAVFYRFRRVGFDDDSVGRPLDGRCEITIPAASGAGTEGTRYDLRMSLVPLHVGQMLTIRMLSQARSGHDTLDEVFPGRYSDIADMIKRALTRRKGLILVAGPTGSGKSNTLAAALSEVAVDAAKVISIEDPVELEIPLVMQIAFHPKFLTFAMGIKSSLRSDPNFMMVGEIRDLPTAIAALEASQTGHPLLSTVHSNDAAGAPRRVRQLRNEQGFQGVDPVQLAEELSLVVAQRLVRRLCRSCSVQGKPNGCLTCKQTGYEGRLAVAETMEVDEEIMELIEQDAPPRMLRACSGYTPFDVHARELVEGGVTDRAEIERVLGRPIDGLD